MEGRNRSAPPNAKERGRDERQQDPLRAWPPRKGGKVIFATPTLLPHRVSALYSTPSRSDGCRRSADNFCTQPFQTLAPFSTLAQH
jgi:hypothetical protein